MGRPRNDAPRPQLWAVAVWVLRPEPLQ